ncbi:MAG: hypothetical protein DCF24_10925 [Cyanobium sp.]|nr:MAG: hypothetical protein DCF24_10925 [Cyanobium sp.]
MLSAAKARELDWGYLQIGRNLRGLEAERERLWWATQTIVVLALLVAGLASWWFSGLAMRPTNCAHLWPICWRWWTLTGRSRRMTPSPGS